MAYGTPATLNSDLPTLAQGTRVALALPASDTHMAGAADSWQTMRERKKSTMNHVKGEQWAGKGGLITSDGCT